MNWATYTEQPRMLCAKEEKEKKKIYTGGVVDGGWVLVQAYCYHIVLQVKE